MTQKTDESFKEYVQRWVKLASRVQPSLLERELVDMFIGTLQGPYLDRMVQSASSGFLDVVLAGEQIENYLKNGKIQGAATTSNRAKKYYSRFPKKNERETNVSIIYKGKVGSYQVPYYQVAVVTPNQ